MLHRYTFLFNRNMCSSCTLPKLVERVNYFLDRSHLSPRFGDNKHCPPENETKYEASRTIEGQTRGSFAEDITLGEISWSCQPTTQRLTREGVI